MQFRLEGIESSGKIDQAEVVALKLLLPSSPGFLAEANFLSRRLAGCDHVGLLKTFWVVGQEFSYPPVPDDAYADPKSLLILMGSAIGAISLQCHASRSPFDALECSEMTLLNCLSYPWILQQPVTRYRIALAEARHLLGARDVTPRLFRSATNLGLSLIVLDRQGHETQASPHLKMEFLPIDMKLDDALGSRIATTLKHLELPVDPVTTFTDRYLVATAKAAEMLGLSTIMRPEYLNLSTDKHNMRLLSRENEYPSLLVSDAVELMQAVDVRTTMMEYPLIVKFSQGKNSEGVSKVTNFHDLFHSVSLLKQTDGISATKIVVEPYISGVEIDANYVLLDGEILFSEIVNDFPSAGDSQSADITADYYESTMLYPSGLPQHECDLIEKSIYHLLLKIGFRTGIFHVEARIRKSEMEYRLSSHGVMDL